MLVGVGCILTRNIAYGGRNAIALIPPTFQGMPPHGLRGALRSRSEGGVEREEPQSMLIQNLQSVQNAAIRFVSGARRRYHNITRLYLRLCQWVYYTSCTGIPVRPQVSYKVADVRPVHQSLSGQAPIFIASCIHLDPDSHVVTAWSDQLLLL